MNKKLSFQEKGKRGRLTGRHATGRRLRRIMVARRASRSGNGEVKKCVGRFFLLDVKCPCAQAMLQLDIPTLSRFPELCSKRVSSELDTTYRGDIEEVSKLHCDDGTRLQHFANGWTGTQSTILPYECSLDAQGGLWDAEMIQKPYNKLQQPHSIKS